MIPTMGKELIDEIVVVLNSFLIHPTTKFSLYINK